MENIKYNKEQGQNMLKKEMSYSTVVFIGLIEMLVLYAIVLGIAGSISYWQGWAFCTSMLVYFLIVLVVFKDKKELFQERVSPGPGMKKWDYIFYVVFVPAFIAVLIVAPLDYRFLWTGTLPNYVYIISWIAYIFGMYFIAWSMYVNTWFSSVVRIQKDRKQKVVQTGPYSFVRHPGYVAASCMAIGSALVLGSLWALIPAAIVVIALIPRTYLEDITLQKGLKGYKEYTKKVKYRLLPGFW